MKYSKHIYYPIVLSGKHWQKRKIDFAFSRDKSDLTDEYEQLLFLSVKRIDGNAL